MGQFSVFRGRILSALVAAGVAQACGGTVEGGPSEEGEGTPPITNKPGCQPVLGPSERVAVMRTTCGGSPTASYCTETPSTECLDSARVAISLRLCHSGAPGNLPGPHRPRDPGLLHRALERR
jgi:hypothetical protein